MEDSVAVTDAELPAAYAERNAKAKKGDFRGTMNDSDRATWPRNRAGAGCICGGLMNKAMIKINEPGITS